MSERSINSIFLTKLKQMETAEGERIQFSRPPFQQKNKNAKKPIITKKTKTSALKTNPNTEIIRPKSRLQTYNGNSPADSAFPVLHSTNSTLLKPEAEFESDKLPDYYNIKKRPEIPMNKQEIFINDKGVDIKESPNNSTIKNEPPPPQSPPEPIDILDIVDALNNEPNEPVNNDELLKIDKQIKDISNHDITEILELFKEEEEKREPVIVNQNEAEPIPISNENSFISNSEKCAISGKISPINSSLHVQIDEPSEVSLTLPLNETQNNISTDESSDALIPERLLDIINLDRTSISYLALTGMPVDGYSPKRLRDAITEMNEYLDTCIESGYIQESRFVENAINCVKNSLEESMQIRDLTPIYDIEDRLSSLVTEMAQKQEYFLNQNAKNETERDISLKELEYKLDEDLDEIDRVWTSKEQTKKYDKISYKLRSLRKEAATLLSAKRFTEAEIVSEEANKLTKIEYDIASKKMNEDYQKDIQSRKRKYKIDKEAIISQYERKNATLLKEKKRVESVLQRRQEKLITKKKNIEQKICVKPQRKRTKSYDLNPSIRTSPIKKGKRSSLLTDIKDPSEGLSLKPLKRAKRHNIL